MANKLKGDGYAGHHKYKELYNKNKKKRIKKSKVKKPIETSGTMTIHGSGLALIAISCYILTCPPTIAISPLFAGILGTLGILIGLKNTITFNKEGE